QSIRTDACLVSATSKVQGRSEIGVHYGRRAGLKASPKDGVQFQNWGTPQVLSTALVGLAPISAVAADDDVFRRNPLKGHLCDDVRSRCEHQSQFRIDGKP